MNDDYKIKSALFDLLIELKRICDKNNINYFLIGGTLIGAIRHNGFIPWDDDIDVGMLREEYERFIEACKEDLSKEYRIVNCENEEDNPNMYSKLKIIGTKYVEDALKNTNQNKEIFLDIFPFDNSPNNIIKAYIHGIKIKYYRRLLAIKCGITFDANRCILKRLGNTILKYISLLYTKEKLYKINKNLVKKYNNKQCNFIVNAYGSYSYLKERQNKDIFNKVKLANFENDKFKVFQSYDIYLKKIYGDYMKLPPEKERTGRHKIIEVDFGEYKIHNKLERYKVEK